jgi:UDP-N-acetylmuramate dehydrogenase
MAIPNTLAVSASAVMGCVAGTEADVQEARARARAEGLGFVALGQGSNIIAHANVEKFVCLVRLRGIEVVAQSATEVQLHVAAGENWHQLVLYCLRRDWFGLENLSLIPGSVGAAPVQNIGAYGVELARFVESVEVIDGDGHKVTLSAAECGFAYRDSTFKARDDLTIVALNLRLDKIPAIVTDYPELAAELEAQGQHRSTPQQVSDAVIAIRQRKLPDPAIVPNVGSFFKNPFVSRQFAHQLVQRFPHLKVFEQTVGMKLSAAQLIDEAGWKGKQKAGVACWQHQPLVLVNRANASTRDVLSYADSIRQDVLAKFGVQLELEPSLLS